MAVNFYIKQDDLLPEIQATLKDADDTVIDLSGATVKFIMTDKLTNEKKIDANAVVVNDTGGVVKYVWTGTDTDTAGNYKGEFELKFADGRLMTVPNKVYINIKVVADLGGFDGTPA